MPVEIIRLNDVQREERVNVDRWPCRAGMYRDDPALSITLRLFDYPMGSTEPGHVHAGTHLMTRIAQGRRFDPFPPCGGRSGRGVRPA